MKSLTPQQDSSRRPCPHSVPSSIPGHRWQCIDEEGHGGQGHYCTLVAGESPSPATEAR